MKNYTYLCNIKIKQILTIKQLKIMAKVTLLNVNTENALSILYSVNAKYISNILNDSQSGSQCSLLEEKVFKYT